MHFFSISEWFADLSNRARPLPSTFPVSSLFLQDSVFHLSKFTLAVATLELTHLLPHWAKRSSLAPTLHLIDRLSTKVGTFYTVIHACLWYYCCLVSHWWTNLSHSEAHLIFFFSFLVQWSNLLKVEIRQISQGGLSEPPPGNMSDLLKRR